MKKVLLAEDDFDFADVLKQYLELYNYHITWAKDGEEALLLFENETFDICVFDIMMPKMDGFTLAQKIIDMNPETPFVFLTARKLKEDKLKGLQLGADDYIVKPFEADELVLRLNNILKRGEQKNQTTFSGDEIAIGNYIFDPNRLELKLGNHTQRLTVKEVAIILFFLKNKNKRIKRNDILQHIWGNDDFFSGRSMDVFISRIRKYFSSDNRITIESIRNVGLEFKIIT
ncbi:TPA: response regulator transcription factor [Flavobacterium psychrophilum]|uniref:response regulator transcription factor n=1 Tax=Flavobacterium psychrophilum TaxID=96345 RepID=UPI00073F4B3F|nr:response regulator transcription factor [Flavobacterium psychrophilum]GAQ49950.1 DNA-binding response regulator [Flavobacterium psychrophilum]GEJ29146.1 DNA-binding response regulator [Flavobacterium psychrophilum]GEJ29337.1 DNA-binding response regulator [Flavobacterium psychrophilum]GEJ29924.1 DNA-binding response regulator [Flavobacterium psychrophilum]GEJ34270.1 DNA-binding response regulator [Flavobacterium psychrophilum]